MRVQIGLYTQDYVADLKLENGVTKFELLPEEQKRLEEYLRLVLPHYMKLEDEIDQIPYEQLLDYAEKWQQANPDVPLAEPTIKLPYDIPIEVKAMLENLAKVNGISQTQLLLSLIDEEFEKVGKEQQH